VNTSAAETALRLTFRPLAPGAILLALVACAAALLLAAWALRGLPPRRRAVLLGLRAIGVGCALALFFQPALRRERRALQPSRVVVLLDESASMSLPLAGSGGPTRLQRALELARDAGALADPAAGRSVEIYAAGVSHGDAPVALPLAALDAQSPTGGRTALLEALEALPRAIDRDLAAVIVLSDGADHGRAAPQPLDAPTRDQLATLDAPVHTLALGEAEVRDLVVGRVARDDFAFVRTPIDFDVPIEVLGDGWAGRTVAVVLRRDGVVVEARSLTLRRGTQHLSLRHVPDRVGEFVFDVSVPVQPGELTAANNLQRFSLRVVRDRVRVLQVCGRPSWDERFLRSLLKRDPNVDLISFFILRTPSAIELASPDELALIPFPTDELFRESLHTFDLVVLQNFNYGPYQMSQYLPFIARYVEEGGALAMLGGDLSFGLGGYAGTPIESILPVELEAADGKGAHAGPGLDARPVNPKLTAVGRAHPLTALALDVEESAREFASLPALDGVNLVRRARPEATVLAVHPTLLDADRQPLPIISVREAGRGRVLAVGSDSTWRWGFEGDAHGTRRPYERFWESAIRWLVRDPALSLLRIELDRAALDARGALPIHVTAVGPDYRPIAGAQVRFALERVPDPEGTGAHGVAPVAPEAGVTDERGVLDRSLGALPEGAYRLTARARLGGRDVEDGRVFLIDRNAAELADPAARPALLRSLSDATGGQARPASAGIGGLPVRPPREIRIAASEDRPLWTSPLLLFVAVGAMCAAWALGRRWGRR
jgi:uncharacterized membrane protein